MDTDLNSWRNPYAWWTHTTQHKYAIKTTVNEPLLDSDWVSFITEWKNKYTMEELTALTRRGENKFDDFRQAFVKFWKAKGYDGISYVNKNEDINSRSYIVFNEEQVSPTDSYSFNPLS